MRQQIVQLMLVGLLISIPLTANSKIVFVEDVIEGAYIHTVAFSGNHHGYLKLKRCEDCPTIKLSFDRSTKIYSKGKAVALKYLPSRSGKKVNSVKFTLKNKRVTKIMW